MMKPVLYGADFILMSYFVISQSVELMVCSFTKKNPVGKKNAVGRRRRNSFFVSGVSRAKMVTLQINGLSDVVSTVAYCNVIVQVGNSIYTQGLETKMPQIKSHRCALNTA